MKPATHSQVGMPPRRLAERRLPNDARCNLVRGSGQRALHAVQLEWCLTVTCHLTT